MSRHFGSLALAALLVSGTALAQQKDLEGSKDHPLLTRMPGYVIERYETKEFDSLDMSAYLSGADATWEGRSTRIGYALAAGGRQISMQQIARNHEAALKRAGAKILFSDGRVVGARIDQNGATAWAMVSAFNEGQNYELVVVESAPMKQEVVADAAALAQGIGAEGKVAVYGIYFDVNKAVVKPESAPALEQIAKLLAQSPRLRLFVVGHTDGTGSAEANARLSRERAAAVVAALVARGVAAGRLEPIGVGSYCPVATNRSEDGKAKNRRVELVERL